MASHQYISSWKTTAILALALALSVQQGIIGGVLAIECEDLKKESCAFAVSSSGKRCVLEKVVVVMKRGGWFVDGEDAYGYTCRASEIEADNNNNNNNSNMVVIKDWIETDQCIEACGLDRTTSLGISSDSLLEPHFTRKLCSPRCYNSCPNIVDLYFNLAAGEGVFLPKLCEAQGKNARRALAEMKSSGYVAPGPEAGGDTDHQVVHPVVLDYAVAAPPANAMAPH